VCSRSAKTFTHTQGQYLAFIHAYTRLHRRPPAETDMQEYFRVNNDFNHPIFDEVSRGPWRDVERYARNSPMLAVENITAPLMIVHGDLDFVPIQQDEEMFSALRYLGKHVRFVR
jgi:dipeptidyl aminopeptidase/acylaminoacyl peptidase